MQKMIDPKAAREHILANYPNDPLLRSMALTLVEGLPKVEVREVVPGRWISDESDVLFHCSECETQISTSWDYDDLHWNYCPDCGAQMDGGADNG